MVARRLSLRDMVVAQPLAFLAPEHRDDPYPAMAALRDDAPVADAGGVWVLSRFAECRAALLDPRFRSGLRKADGFDPTDPLAQAAGALMVYNDPPDHTRLRGLVQKAFTPRRGPDPRPRGGAVVAGLIGAPAAAGGVGGLAGPPHPPPLPPLPGRPARP